MKRSKGGGNEIELSPFWGFNLALVTHVKQKISLYHWEHGRKVSKKCILVSSSFFILLCRETAEGH